MCITHKTHESYNLRGSIVYAPQLIVRDHVLVTIKRNGCVTQGFPEAVFTQSTDIELPDAVGRDVNSAVLKVLEEERASRRKRKCALITPEDGAKFPSTQLSDSEALCQGVSKSRREYSELVQETVSSRFEGSWI